MPWAPPSATAEEDARAMVASGRLAREVILPLLLLLGNCRSFSQPDIHAAATAGDVKVLAEQAGQGAGSLEVRDTKKRTPLHLAAFAGHAEATELLLQLGADASPKDGRSLTPLHYAAFEGHMPVLQLLVDRSVDFSIVGNVNGESALHSAVRGDHVPAVELLLESGISMHVKDRYGRDPIQWSAFYGSPEAFRFLATRGAQFGGSNRETEFGGACLHWAAGWGHVAMTQLLVDEGADLELTTTAGATPLFLAAENGQASAVELLLGLGADPSRRGPNGETPLEIAKESAEGNARQATKNAKVKQDLVAAHEAGDSDQIHFLEALLRTVTQPRGGSGEEKDFPQVVEVLRRHLDAKQRSTAPQTAFLLGSCPPSRARRETTLPSATTVPAGGSGIARMTRTLAVATAAFASGLLVSIRGLKRIPVRG